MRMNATSFRRSARSPGVNPASKNAEVWSGSAQVGWLNALVTPVLRGSTFASVTFWANAASSLVCSVSVSNCVREWSVDNSMTF